MDTNIGAFDETLRNVTVTFTEGDIVHTREVNACLDKTGAYDEAATTRRVADVARGVAVKIGLGVIKAEPETFEPPIEQEPVTDPAPAPTPDPAPAPEPQADPAPETDPNA